MVRGLTFLALLSVIPLVVVLAAGTEAKTKKYDIPLPANAKPDEAVRAVTDTTEYNFGVMNPNSADVHTFTIRNE